jgi:drug/metabolite transporter (DMT)-like permease
VSKWPDFIDKEARLDFRLQFPSDVPQRRAAVRFGLLYGALAALGWGVGLAAAHRGFSVGFEPFDLLFLRYAVAAPILFVLYRATKRSGRIAKTKGTVAMTLALVGGPLLAICVVTGGRKAPFSSGILIEVAALSVCSIVLARLLLSERLGLLRTVAMLALTARLAVLAFTSLADGSPEVGVGIALFAAGGLAAATFAALSCRWRVDPITAMTIVSSASLATFGPYYVFVGGLSRLSAIPWALLLEQMVCQGLIAGLFSWIGFLYAARILGLVTASFMPAVTPAVAALITMLISRESPTMLQWGLIAFGTFAAALLIANLHAKTAVSAQTS